MEQLSDKVIALERNQQDEDNQNTTRIRLLKNRGASKTGVAGYADYNEITGRLLPCDEPKPQSKKKGGKQWSKAGAKQLLTNDDF